MISSIKMAFWLDKQKIRKTKKANAHPRKIDLKKKFVEIQSGRAKANASLII
tara:strand:- start:14919 stop:15074 length:156 start_codon:yes stop_codon:yes gene_type:complete